MDIPFENLKANFKMEFRALKDKVYRDIVPKKINGKKLTGPVLAQLIVEFVNTINNGHVPNISNSWDSVINKDVKDYYEKALMHFKVSIKKLPNVLNNEELINELLKNRLQSFMIFNKLLNLNQETFSNFQYMNLYNETQEKLAGEINKLFLKIIENNNIAANTLSKDIYRNSYKDVNYIFD